MSKKTEKYSILRLNIEGVRQEIVETGSRRGWTRAARGLPLYAKTERNAFIFVSGESSANNRAPITLAHLGRRSTYSRQIGRNDVEPSRLIERAARRRNPPTGMLGVSLRVPSPASRGTDELSSRIPCSCTAQTLDSLVKTDRDPHVLASAGAYRSVIRGGPGWNFLLESPVDIGVGSTIRIRTLLNRRLCVESSS